MKGTVLSYDYKNGFGLILGEDNNEVFVYKKDLDFLILLDPGDEVEYQIKQSEKGLKAVNVKIIKDSLFKS